ncbi:MAG: hypothetical protein L7U83_04975 [Akkermansiaceae bacterium]|nr:hypothetical protein [Akkermansiaceae bacterium]
MNTFQKTFSKISGAFVAAVLTTGSLVAEITIDGMTSVTERSADFTFTFPADTADKLVVIITGEHGFNNANGALNSLTYDDVELTEAVYRNAQVAQTDILYHGIWYLDNPSTSTGAIRVRSQNRGTVSAFLVNGTAEGHGATEITAVGERSVSLITTQTDSMIFAAFGVGGDGNTGNTNSIEVDAPLIEIAAIKDPNNWQGHVIGAQTVANPGVTTSSFTGGTESGAVVAAVEFLSASGTAGLPFAISEISVNSAISEVTLTWPKTGVATSVVKVSTDLLDWSVDIDDGITPDLDENPDDASNITVTIPLPENLIGSSKLFFRIEED